MYRISLAVAVASLVIPSLAIASPPAAPPAPRRVDVVEQVFGNTLHDPYRWMENQPNPEFQRWIAAEGEYARASLDALPTLASWQKTVQSLNQNAVRHFMQRMAGGRMFFIRQGLEGSGTLMVREADGHEHVLLDPATLKGKGGSPSITNFSPSPDGGKVAVNVDRGGSEVTRVHVFDVATGKLLADSVEPVWGEFQVSWLPDGQAFAYTQMAPPKERTDGDPLQDMRLRLHRLGTPASADPILLRAGAGKGSNPTFPIPGNRFPIVDFPGNSRWALGWATGAQVEKTYCVALRSELVRRSATWHCIAGQEDKVVDAAIHGDTLYLISVREHSNGQLLSLDLSQQDASLKDAKPMLSLKDDEIIVDTSTEDAQTLAMARDALYLKVVSNGNDQVRRIDYATGLATPVSLPMDGTASMLQAKDTVDGFLVELRGWTMPPKSWRYDPAAGGMKPLGQDETSPADYDMIAVTETEAVSKDGTRVPLTILHRKDVALDGSHKALVVAYGSYGVSLRPSFRPPRMEWVRQGNIAAYVHVRGGGEKGEAWHVAGKGANKHKGVEDVVAAVERLDELGYSRPQHTALIAGSAGGLVVGGAVTGYPLKFGAAVLQVPMLNPVRLMYGPNGANQIGEMGDPRKASDFPGILAMDPYQNIKPGTAYPPMMFMIGLNDGRVPPWETGKFVASVRMANTSGRPVWIRTDTDGGHGITMSMDAETAEWADIFAFLDANL